MKFRYLIIATILFGCSNNYTKLENRQPFNAKGFAYIYNDKDFKLKIIKTRFDNSKLEISHKDLKFGTLIKIINPKTKDNLVLKNNKKSNYSDFYKILITDAVAKKLNIEKDLPLIEVLEIKKNKSFVAQKAKVFQEEKKIINNAPITSVKIANISKKKTKKKTITNENITILVASFYTREAANLLIKRIADQVPNFDIKKINIKKKTNKEFEVLSGPYKSVNLLKNDYIILKNFGFEEMDIIIDE